jgi:hypothetical protein
MEESDKHRALPRKALRPALLITGLDPVISSKTRQEDARNGVAFKAGKLTSETNEGPHLAKGLRRTQLPMSGAFPACVAAKQPRKCGQKLDTKNKTGARSGGRAPGAFCALRREGNPTRYRLSAAV